MKNFTDRLIKKIILIFLLSMPLMAICQNSSPAIESMELNSEAFNDTMAHVTMILNLSGTESISKIHVKVKDEVGKVQFEHSFNSGGNEQIPRCCSFLKEGNNVKLGMGYYKYERLIYEARLEDLQGNYSPITIKESVY